LAVVVAIAFANVTAAASRDPPIDHFVLALSWSPSFCALPEAADEVLQCAAGRRFAFVVHGLWPHSQRMAAILPILATVGIR
jgi:ribonuclease T2